MMSEHKDRLDLLIKQVFQKMKKQGPKPAVCPDEELLAAYRNGSLEEEEKERIEEHLAFCSKCADSLISFAEAESSYSSKEETYSTDKMLKRAQALIKPKERASLWDRISPWLTPLRLKPAMVMATVVLVVVVYGLLRMQTPSPEKPLPVRLSFIARIPPQDLTRGTSGEYKEVEVQNGGVLHSEDLFKIRFKPQEEVYVYLLSMDSLGNLKVLSPAQHTGTLLKFKSDETYEFPEKNKWFELDQNTGQETIYLITTQTPIETIDKKIDELQKSGINNINEIFPNARIQSFRFEHRQKITR